MTDSPTPFNNDSRSAQFSLGGNSSPANPVGYNGSPLAASQMEVPAIQCFLVNKLHQHIQSQGIHLDPQDIPIHPIKDPWPIRYQSAIALKLATMIAQQPTDIATEMLRGFSLKSKCGDIGIQVIPSGMIEFQLTDHRVATCLQQMTQTPLAESSFPVSSKVIIPENNHQKLFAVQYSHARCCSLLQLADRDRIITLTQATSQTTSLLWLFVKPSPIPWLDPEGKLQLSHRDERQLIWHLLTSLDACCTSSDQRFWKNKANLLSQAFQAFYSQCQIWGEVKLKTPQRSQARLGLILITQSILKFILQEKLGIIAPLEL
jgi:arginyl-tRNA synthetase